MSIIYKQIYDVYTDSEWLKDKIKPEDLPKIVDNFYSGYKDYGINKEGTYKSMVTKNHADTGDVDAIIGYVSNIGADENGKLWAELTIKDTEYDKRIDEGLVPDVSVGLVKDKTSKSWILDHVAAVRVPAVKGMAGFIRCSEEGIETMDEGIERITINCKEGDYIMEKEEVITKDIPVEDDLWARFEEYCSKNEIDPLVEVANLVESYMSTDDVELESEPVNEEKKSLVDRIKGLFKRPKVEVEMSEGEKAVETQEEVKEEIKATEVEEVTEVKDETLELKETLEVKEKEIIELKEKLEKEKEDIIEAKRVEDWDRTWDSYIGIKCIPAERDSYIKLLKDPKELKEILELRADLNILERTKYVLKSETNDELTLDDLDEEEKQFVSKQGWDKPGKEQYLKLHLELKKKEKENK